MAAQQADVVNLQNCVAQLEGAQSLNNASHSFVPTFSNSLENNVNTFLQRLEAYYQICGIQDDDTKFSLLKCFLQGRPSTWADLKKAQYNAQNPYTWANFRAAFIQEFNSDRQKFLIRSQMYNRTQKPNEPAEDFIASIGSYISRLGLGENDYKDNLIRGFNSHIRSAILEKSPENLSQVIHIALAAEAAKQLREESKSSRAMKSMETLFPWETDAEASTALHNLQRLLQSVLSTQQHISPVQSLVTSNPISNPPLNTPEAQYGLAQAKAFSQAAITEAMPQPHYQPPRHLAFTCNYCGGAGHFAAACPSDPRNSLDPRRPLNPHYNPRFSRAPQRPFQ